MPLLAASADGNRPTQLDEGAPADLVVLGRIGAAYGVRGAVHVQPFADDPAAWSTLPQWWLGRDSDELHGWRSFGLRRCTLRGDRLLACLDGVVDRTAAEALRGLLVGVSRQALPPTGNGEYYWVDLVGLEVTNTRAESLGRVLGLLETPANAVLRVGDGVGEERLLPFVGAVVLEVDLAGRCLRVDWEADW